MIFVIDGQGGWITSFGIRKFAKSLSRDYDVQYGFNPRYPKIIEKGIKDYVAFKQFDYKIILIGYSLGGNCTTWVANALPDVTFDLLVAYDPTVNAEMKVLGSNVKKAVCYHNTSRFGTSLLFGGAAYSSVAMVDLTTRNINMDHCFVQNDAQLHALTRGYIKKIIKAVG